MHWIIETIRKEVFGCSFFKRSEFENGGEDSKRSECDDFSCVKGCFNVLVVHRNKKQEQSWWMLIDTKTEANCDGEDSE